MSTIIPRDEVHQYSEACADMGEAFQPVAMRLSKRQKRLMKYLEEQFSSFDPLAGQIAMYMASVCMRVFEQSGGDMRKVNTQDIRDAEAKIKPLLSQVLPAGDGFSDRAKAVDRSQPHLMDEVLWALFDRAEEEQKEDEMPLNTKQSAQIYLMRWVAVEALNGKWRS